ncbi:hypothetical protein SCATT_01240 [Streptantibioticus cattleyicolor NRRL 8057 = DSM 46488]|uniref:Uncharacterized protein n=1 Tax=Streptantibioticus cattleyicolor (strain ATCC 35852 / DSM 46488 / JCM 4925 / NBRC 14057 / NRRL 8057) TaxID=1003195 RepID=G8X1G7_STREN|nr:hypothetical protein SCATT_01240 [Streptantibioticus cattleyicolor NRRL 8057 = DSM 46488]
MSAVSKAPARKGANGCRPLQAPPTGTAHAADPGRCTFTEVTRRQGSRDPMRSHFAALRVRTAGHCVNRPPQGPGLGRTGLAGRRPARPVAAGRVACPDGSPHRPLVLEPSCR